MILRSMANCVPGSNVSISGRNPSGLPPAPAAAPWACASAALISGPAGESRIARYAPNSSCSSPAMQPGNGSPSVK